MPAMANIVAKKADEVTNVTYDALAPAGGDGSKAVWRQDTGAAAALPVGHRASLEMRTVWNGPRTARRVELSFKMPYAVQNSTTTRYEVTDSVPINLSMTIPQAIPASVISEAVYQALNCFASSLVKTSAASGYAPT